MSQTVWSSDLNMICTLRKKISAMHLLDRDPDFRDLFEFPSFRQIDKWLHGLQQELSNNHRYGSASFSTQINFVNDRLLHIKQGRRKCLEDYAKHAARRCGLPISPHLNDNLSEIGTRLKSMLPRRADVTKELSDSATTLKNLYNKLAHSEMELATALGEDHDEDAPRHCNIESTIEEIEQLLGLIAKHESVLDHILLSESESTQSRTIEYVKREIESSRPLNAGFVLSAGTFGSTEILHDLVANVVRTSGSQPATLMVVGPDFDTMVENKEIRKKDTWVTQLSFALREITRHMGVVAVVSCSKQLDEALVSPTGFDVHELFGAPTPESLPRADCCPVVYTAVTSDPNNTSRSFEGADGSPCPPLLLVHCEKFAALVAADGEEPMRLLLIGFQNALQATRLLESLARLGPSEGELRHLVFSQSRGHERIETNLRSARCFFANNTRDHLASILCLGQLCAIETDLKLMKQAGSDVKLELALLRRYEQRMQSSCGGRSHRVIRTQVPLSRRSRLSNEDYSTLLHAIASTKRDRCVLVAPAGSGKTTQMLFAASEMLRIQLPGREPYSPLHSKADSDDRRWLVKRLPVVLQAPQIAAAYKVLEEQSRSSDVLEILGTILQLDAERLDSLEAAMRLGTAIFLIDALDELDPGNHLPAEFVSQLLDLYNSCPAVLTSRTSTAIPSVAHTWPVLTLRPLEIRHVREYVEERCTAAEELGLASHGLRALDQKLIKEVPPELHLLRHPIFLRLFCDALLAAPDQGIDCIPKDRAGIYGYLLRLVVTAVGEAVGDPAFSPDDHLAALAEVARSLMLPQHAVERPAFLAIRKDQLRDLLLRQLQRFGASAEIAEKLSIAYLSAHPTTSIRVPPLFELLHEPLVRFAHRSLVEYLAAWAIYRHYSAEAGKDVPHRELAKRIGHCVFDELSEIGDDNETSRFFIGMLLRGSQEWERGAADKVLQRLMDEMQDVRFLQLLNDVGSARDAGLETAWLQFTHPRVQAKLGELIRRTRSTVFTRDLRTAGSTPGGAASMSAAEASSTSMEVVRLLEPFVLQTPRNPYLMYFAVEALEGLVRKSERRGRGQSGEFGYRVTEDPPPHAVAADEVLQEAWQQSRNHSQYRDSIPARELSVDLLASWKAGGAVPRPHMVRVEGGRVFHPEPESGLASEIETFYLSDTLVTEAQWCVFKGEEVNEARQLVMPQTGIIWYEAVAFARWLFGGDGKLPTRSQWLRALCGEEQISELPWDPSKYRKRANTSESDLKGPTPVNAYPPQGCTKAIYDLVGNLWEWTSTTFVDEGVAKRKQNEKEPQFEYHEGEGYAKMLQGGSFAHAEDFGFCRTRFPSAEGNFVNVIGTRICISEKEYEKWLNNPDESS